MIYLIDDKRNTLPDGRTPDIIARTFFAGGIILGLLTADDELYVDHDLGDPDPNHTGYTLLGFLELEVMDITRTQDTLRHELGENLLHSVVGRIPHKIACVSDNGPGRLRINQVIENLKRHG